MSEYRFEDVIYNSDYGIFYWAEKKDQLKPHWRKVAWCNCGSIATNGYLQIYSEGKIYQAHRLAWFLITGEWPKGQIDHINRNKTDNRFENLRVVTNRVNARNRKDNQKFPGVRKIGKKYQARIKINKKEHHLGMFNTEEEAIKMYFHKFNEVSAYE